MSYIDVKDSCLRGQKKIWVQKSFGSTQFWYQRKLVLKNEGKKSCLTQTFLDPNIFIGAKKFFVGLNKFWVQRIWVQEKSPGPKKFGVKNFCVQNSLGQARCCSKKTIW